MLKTRAPPAARCPLPAARCPLPGEHADLKIQSLAEEASMLCNRLLGLGI